MPLKGCEELNTRDLILKNAYELFQEKSYNAVSIDDICGRCKLTKPAFYYHFKSKAELLLHYYDDVVEYIDTSLEDQDAQRNYWQQIVYCFSELIMAGNQLGADLMSQLYITNLTKDHGSFNFNQQLIALCVELIKKGQASGQIENPKEANDLFISASLMFTGFETLWSIKKRDIQRERNFIIALETIFVIPPEYSVQEKQQHLNYSDFS